MNSPSTTLVSSKTAPSVREHLLSKYNFNKSLLEIKEAYEHVHLALQGGNETKELYLEDFIQNIQATTAQLFKEIGSLRDRSKDQSYTEEERMVMTEIVDTCVLNTLDSAFETYIAFKTLLVRYAGMLPNDLPFDTERLHVVHSPKELLTKRKHILYSTVAAHHIEKEQFGYSFANILINLNIIFHDYIHKLVDNEKAEKELTDFNDQIMLGEKSISLHIERYKRLNLAVFAEYGNNLIKQDAHNALDEKCTETSTLKGADTEMKVYLTKAGAALPRLRLTYAIEVARKLFNTIDTDLVRNITYFQEKRDLEYVVHDIYTLNTQLIKLSKDVKKEKEEMSEEERVVARKIVSVLTEKKLLENLRKLDKRYTVIGKTSKMDINRIDLQGILELMEVLEVLLPSVGEAITIEEYEMNKKANPEQFKQDQLDQMVAYKAQKEEKIATYPTLWKHIGTTVESLSENLRIAEIM